MQHWAGVQEGLSDAVREQSRRCLAAYREDPLRVEADSAIEVGIAEGGYGRKQVYELIQNGADALLGAPGRIEVVLTTEALYVANEGAPVTEAGVDALMASHLSRKRSGEIGRFGLGFKSVVALSDSPQVFSRSGSFGFDREAAEKQIRRVVPGATRFPVLRLAEPLDPDAHAAEDRVLASMMSWAATVIRLPLKDGHDAVSEDLAGFPAEFVLFSPHVTRLRIHSVSEATPREIVLGTSGSDLVLTDRGRTTHWQVFQTKHVPSAEAAKDAGELVHRPVVTVHWAVPVQVRNRPGQFWAFFPTESRTTLSGIVNAPWKLSDDRRNLLEGRFNKEILTEVLPELIAKALPALAQREDPASVLDLLPARGRESRSWADEIINVPVFARLSRSRSLPDVNGTLCSPEGLTLHPKGLLSAWLDDWAASPGRPGAWVHRSVDSTPERRLKAERLVSDRPTSIANVTEWLEALLNPASVEASAVAVSLVARIVEEDLELGKEARAARVLLLEDGQLVAARPGTVFVRTSEDEERHDFIHPELAALPGVVAALDRLGIRVFDRSGDLRNALAKANLRDIDWTRVWALTRGMPLDVADAILRESLPISPERSVNVRTADGRWKPLGDVFIGGGVIPLDGSRDRAFLIDPAFHQQDLELLTRLGAVAQPATRQYGIDEPWLRAYRDVILEDFIAKAQSSKPMKDRLEAHGPKPPRPLDPLSRMSPQGRVAMTEVALNLDSGEPWTVHHSSNQGYGKRTYKSPVSWWLRKHGMLKTAFGPWPVAQCLRPSEELQSDVLPVADVSDSVATRLSLSNDVGLLTQESWERMIRIAGEWADELKRYTVYAWAVHYMERPPQHLRVTVAQRVQDVPTRDIAAVTDKEVYRSLVEQHIPTVFLEDPDDMQAMLDRWGMAEGSRLLQRELVSEPAGESELLIDRFPALRLYLSPADMSLELQRCAALELVTATPRGQVSRPIPGALHEGRVLVTAVDPEGMLRQISNAMKLDLSAEDIRNIIEQQEQQQAQELLADIRAAEDVHARLALAVGADALRRSVPRSALEAIEGELERQLTDGELARLAHSVHGVSVLHHFRSVLEERGLNPPAQWAGKSAARRFVAELGFPTEYAGFSEDRRPAVMDVEGPAVLGPLHDYQVVVTQRIKALMAGHGPGRGMVSLPTGAGKTRVAVQALIEEIREGALPGPVVWIAQSDELCEQAVQTWAYVWRAIGPRRRMVISRFWSTNEVTEEPSDFQLVVATPEKLRNAVGKQSYEWLSQASVVLVDEAHASVAPTYTFVLDWLGRGRSRAARRPLIGLTATPFRNTNVEETERLAGRYDRNRLDEGAFAGDPYAELQARGVLARVRHAVLEGVEVALSSADVAEINQFDRLPRRLETQLGENHERNRRIIDSVTQLPDDWTVLLFATSVENARALAAQLTFRGIPSVAISADTEPAARRHHIEEFKRGTIRVMTNYNVLAQGFDAPAVRAVYVTRPTFSTNLYQQMIGRGLRGPLNGGSEEVLIVNVRDNLQQYGDRLAFYDFEHLWAGS